MCQPTSAARSKRSLASAVVSRKIAKTYEAALAELNARQREAFDEKGNTVLLAGPGSGKTATLVLKVARLLDEIPAPRGLACLTYGNEAAREFERRLRDYGIRCSGRLFTGTVHSFCLAHVLRPFARLLGPHQRHLATSEIASDAELKEAREKGLEAGDVNESETWWKSKLEEYRKLALVDPAFAQHLDDRLPKVSEGYAAHLRAMNRIDFDDIVLGSLVLIRDHEHVRRALAAKYPWFVIDEYQDLGLALHCIVKLLVGRPGVQVFAVGDPDQSIYNFSGARPEFLDELANRQDFRQVRLELNYRCRQEIIDGSLHVLQAAESRNFVAAQGDERGEIIFKGCKQGLDEQAAHVVAHVRDRTAKGVPPGEVGVFAKRWDDLAPCEKALAGAGIPYRIVRGREYKATPLTMWVEAMAAWCAGGWRLGRPRVLDMFSAWRRLSSACREVSTRTEDLADRVTLYGALSPIRDPQMTVGAWVKAVDAVLGLSAMAKTPDKAPLRMRYDVRELGAMIGSLSNGVVAGQTLAEFAGVDRDKVVLQSMHASKGLEYTIVFMLALEDGVIPQYKEDKRDARRLFYVGMTRARREVHLLCSGFFYSAKGKRVDLGPSPFLEELWNRLKPRRP